MTVSNSSSLAPVVVFYTGGAWCIGYKMWGALLARTLTRAGIVVVIPDYRNYPSACIPEMVQDVETSLQWTRQHVAAYGGDPNKIVVVGQSAGGHLACTLFIKEAVELLQEKETNDDAPRVQDETNEEKIKLNTSTCPDETTPFQPMDFAGFISLSAPYDLNAMQSTFQRHGLDEHIVNRLFDGQGNAYTPTQILATCPRRSLTNKLPPFEIYHGTMDKTVPFHGSQEFCRQLECVVDNKEKDAVVFCSYDGWSHTDGILEMPMDANHRFHKDVFDAVQHWTDSEELVWPEDDPIIAKRLCPHWLIRIGQSCNPF